MKNSLSALVIDDDSHVRGFLTEVLQTDHWTVYEASNAEHAFEILKKQKLMLVFCDVNLGGVDGYAVLRRFINEQPGAKFLLMTGYESAAGALEATAIGAYDYLIKPFTVDDIFTISATVSEHLQRAAQTLTADTSTVYQSNINLIGRSPAFMESMKMVGRVAATNLPVLVSGESGTGKEVVARAIHERSNRTAGEFVAVNCGAIPVELIESELLGHARLFHRRKQRARRFMGRSRRRHDFSGRNHRNRAVVSGQITPRFAAGRNSPRRFKPHSKS